MSTLLPPLTDDQRAVLALWYEVNASLSAYYKLLASFGSAQQAWVATVGAWQQLGIHHTHLKRHEEERQTLESIDNIEQAVQAGEYQLLFADQPEFPAQLLQIFDPPPLLFCRGNIERLQQAQIAMVGSRKPTAHAQKITFDMAQYLAQVGYVITSGLALGVDKRAHLGALAQSDSEFKGRTIGVMGTGIDICYPNHHDQLFNQIVEQGGCLISELLPHTKPHKHTFPRRNRLVAGLSLATIVTEATIKSGSLITARLTSEQGKQVFAVPSHIDNGNAEGCHHLIREGATLIYHPDQVIADVNLQLNLPTIATKKTTPSSGTVERPITFVEPDQNITLSPSNTPQPSNMTTSNKANDIAVSSHLAAVFDQLDWHGQDLDALLLSTKLAPPELIGRLMELELLGLINVQGGRYSRL